MLVLILAAALQAVPQAPVIPTQAPTVQKAPPHLSELQMARAEAIYNKMKLNQINDRDSQIKAIQLIQEVEHENPGYTIDFANQVMVRKPAANSNRTPQRGVTAPPPVQPKPREK